MEQLYSVSIGNNTVKNIGKVEITKYDSSKHKKIRIHFVSPLSYINMSVSGYIERTY